MSLMSIARYVLPAWLALGGSLAADAAVVKGKVTDARTREEIIGAAILVKEDPARGTVTGLDGSFSLETGHEACTLQCSYVGYKMVEVAVGRGTGEVSIRLAEEEVLLEGVTVIAHNPGRSEAGARAIERQSMNVVNVMSAKAIELSPDITVANVIQRMSGVTVERNSSGEGQYAILRGMDKRYNYTLVNGVKIPSPDNKNRFVPLDMFPSEMLDRLEVSKSLTADMEGDGIGGAVDLVMKDAPAERQFTANLSTGYNAMYFGRDFQSFRHRDIARQSPYEAAGLPEDYAVTMDQFTRSNLHMKWARPLPDLTAGLSYGDRFLGDRLGVMLAASYLNTARGKESMLYYQPGTTHNGTERRNYSSRQARTGAHLKLDYHFDTHHKLTWYNGYMDMTEAEVRDGQDEAERSVRMKWNHQYIFNSTLRGEHVFLDNEALRMEWSTVVSTAYSETPDNANLLLNGTHVPQSDAATRRWEHNSDTDQAGYVDLAYKWDIDGRSVIDFSAGGMFRNKRRTSFFNEYTFNSGTADAQYIGQDWSNFDEIVFALKSPYGNIGDPLNYDATEQVGAGYAMAKYTVTRWELIAGLRVEHTRQGYTLRFPRSVDGVGLQRYSDLLPSFHAKYAVHDKANLRLSLHHPQRGLRRKGQPRPATHRGRQPRPALRVLPQLVRAVHGGLVLQIHPEPHRIRSLLRAGARHVLHAHELRQRHQHGRGSRRDEVFQLVRHQGELHLHPLVHHHAEAHHGQQLRGGAGGADAPPLRPGRPRGQPLAAVQGCEARPGGADSGQLHQQAAERHIQLAGRRHLGSGLRAARRVGGEVVPRGAYSLCQSLQPARQPPAALHPSRCADRLGRLGAVSRRRHRAAGMARTVVHGGHTVQAVREKVKEEKG